MTLLKKKYPDEECLKHLIAEYFDGWEIEIALKFKEKDGLTSAIDYLEQTGISSQRGHGGPGIPEIWTDGKMAVCGAIGWYKGDKGQVKVEMRTLAKKVMEVHFAEGITQGSLF